MESNSIPFIVKLVLASERRMPAHFTSGNDRKKTFLIDYDDMTEEDEYEMASQAWHNIPSGLSQDDTFACVKIGEDIMLGCFILIKMRYESKIGIYRRETELINTQLLNKDEQSDELMFRGKLIDDYIPKQNEQEYNITGQ